MPGHEYVPTTKAQKPSVLYDVPSQSYLAPMHETKKVYHLVDVSEGSAGYGKHLETSYSPPAKEYLPPQTEHSKQKYSPPSKGYLPPPIDQHIQQGHSTMENAVKYYISCKIQ